MTNDELRAIFPNVLYAQTMTPAERDAIAARGYVDAPRVPGKRWALLRRDVIVNHPGVTRSTAFVLSWHVSRDAATRALQAYRRKFGPVRAYASRHSEVPLLSI